MSTSTSAEVAASAAGHVLGAASRVVARLRSDRPLHPSGASYAAVVTIPGCASTGGASTGVPWLDEPGVHDVVLRVSRAAGLPPSLPDVHGVALRVRPAGAGPADLLFAGTGRSALGRFLLRPATRLGTGALTTLLPVRCPAGALVLRLSPTGSEPVPKGVLPPSMVLSWALGTGPWRYAGEVVGGARLGPEVDRERHDPVVHQLPGTTQYPVVRLLREPAYRQARRQRPGR
ncbi:hypothetical protein GCM10027517_30200 [Phycicoccus ginsengisoli]